ncbi:MAG TPA: hypothetical protein VGJ53_12440 [Micromonosporaceae bacterium]|jgi:hypothetical protein
MAADAGEAYERSEPSEGHGLLLVVSVMVVLGVVGIFLIST